MITPLYRSQYEVGANARPNDCGQTCCGMHLAALGINVPIDSIRGGTPSGLTDADDLVRIFAGYGVQAHYEMLDSLDQAKPNSILLVQYAPIRQYAQSVGFKGWHWLIKLGIVGDEIETHDPLYWGSQIMEGNRKRYPLAAMRKAFQPYTGVPGVAVVVDGLMPLPEPTTLAGTPYRVIDDVNYRQWYSTSSRIIRELSPGVVVIGYDRTEVNGKYIWRLVDYMGDTGWIADSYLKAA